MSELKFKTNIKCSGCLAQVSPKLNEEEGIQSWSVDLESPERILTVDTEKLLPQEVTAIVKEAGFEATPIPVRV